MFKKITIILMLTITLFVFGCTPKKQPHLEYQAKNFECTAGLKINGENYSINVTKTEKGDYTLTFTSPETVSGITIEKTNGEHFFSVGNVHIPLKENTNITAEALKLFDLSKKELISTVSDMYGGVKVKVSDYQCEFGKVKLYLSADTQLPLRIEADINGNEVVISFSNFTINQ